MPTDVLPELAMSGAQVVRRMLKRRAGAALPDPDVKALLRQSRLTLDFTTDFRDDASAALLEAGLEATGFRETCSVLAETLALFLSSVPDLRALVEQQPDGAGRTARLDELAALERRALDARSSFAEWLAALNRTFPAVDEGRLRQGAAEAEAGLGEDVGDLLSRMKAGGED